MILRVLTLIIIFQSGYLSAEDFLNTLIRKVNFNISTIEQEKEKLQYILKDLPPLTYGQQGEQVGFHSRYLDVEDAPLNITIDLHKEYEVDFLALVPVSTAFQGANYSSYGFPRGFEIFLANDKDFKDKKSVFSTGDKDYHAPGHYPLIIPVDVDKARFIKISISKHWARSDGLFLSAIGELMAMSGNRNVAVGAKVSGIDFKSLPEWSTDFLVDGQTDLGLPISNEPSKVNGFLSLPGNEHDIKWVQLDLGREHELDEIRLLTAHPLDAPNSYSHGFPVKFTLKTSLTENFEKAQIVADYSKTPYRRLGDNMAIFKAEGIKARYVRLDVNELWHISGNGKALALAEVQVMSKGENVAFNCDVTYSDIFNHKNFVHIWNAAGLVDGYTSQNKLIDLDQWLLGLNTRRITEQRIADLEEALIDEKESTTTKLIASSILLVISLLFIVAFNLYRRRLKMKEELEKVRVQIARDLHDDLGSRIGGIRLVSEVALAGKSLDEEAKEDWQSVNESAASAIEAMRDIVWLTDGEAVSSQQMILHLHKVAEETLGNIKLKWHVNSSKEFSIPFSQRRNIVLSFRETLGNIVKHAKASEVEVNISSENKHFSFSVNDNGCGFDLKNCTMGRGLHNLETRAGQSGGRFEVNSQSGKGTSVNFTVKLKDLYE
ncbi:MAG: histidine kinase [Lentisphaeraceae bacterium]|nr:histidine kinase [Lentisphaeraceae bacterium]